MATDLRLKEALPEITEALVATYTECKRINHLGHTPLPSREAVIEIVADLLEVIYPGYGRRQNLHIANIEYHIGNLIDGLHDKLIQQIARAVRHEYNGEDGPIDFPEALELAAPEFQTIGQFYAALDRCLAALPPSAWHVQRNQISDAQ